MAPGCSHPVLVSAGGVRRAGFLDRPYPYLRDEASLLIGDPTDESVLPHGIEFEARLAIEAISGRNTIQGIADDHAIHPTPPCQES